MDLRKRFDVGYMTGVREFGASGLYTVEFVPRGLQYMRGAGNPPKEVPAYRASVNLNMDEPSVSWRTPPQDTEITLEQFNAEAIRLAKERYQAATV
jgi:hypothetical protein